MGIIILELPTTRLPGFSASACVKFIGKTCASSTIGTFVSEINCGRIQVKVPPHALCNEGTHGCMGETVHVIVELSSDSSDCIVAGEYRYNGCMRAGADGMCLPIRPSDGDCEDAHEDTSKNDPGSVPEILPECIHSQAVKGLDLEADENGDNSWLVVEQSHFDDVHEIGSEGMR